ncbi:hypothetical protein HK098_003425 [Nowakowskiella sp. JEL0407]|nr:hypothetical protein HK098_003425 [Nowakowskiella sp. JEL0407]
MASPRKTRHSDNPPKYNFEVKDFDDDEEDDDDEDEDDGVTRCVCGKNESFGTMIQCEACEVWQHCECMGLARKNPKNYFCEICQPEGHPYFKKKAKEASKEQKQPNSASARKSTPPKKRNTMNSLDASLTIPESMISKLTDANDTSASDQQKPNQSADSTSPHVKTESVPGNEKPSTTSTRDKKSTETDPTNVENTDLSEDPPKNAPPTNPRTTNARRNLKRTQPDDSPTSPSTPPAPKRPAKQQKTTKQPTPSTSNPIASPPPITQPTIGAPRKYKKREPQHKKEKDPSPATHSESDEDSSEQPYLPVNARYFERIKILPKFPDKKVSLEELVQRGLMLRTYVQRLEDEDALFYNPTPSSTLQTGDKETVHHPMEISQEEVDQVLAKLEESVVGHTEDVEMESEDSERESEGEYLYVKNPEKEVETSDEVLVRLKEALGRFNQGEYDVVNVH